MIPLISGLGRGMPGEQFFNSYYPIIIALTVGVFFTLRHYFKGNQWTNVERMPDKVVIITGASSGIGLELTKLIAAAGAKVILGCRSLKKIEEARNEIIITLPNANVNFIQLDLSSFKSIKNFVSLFLKTENRLDILINNAGVMTNENNEVTEDGFNWCLQVNYLGHFLLTHLMLDTLKKTPNSRVINNTAHAYKLADETFNNFLKNASLEIKDLPNTTDDDVIYSIEKIPDNVHDDDNDEEEDHDRNHDSNKNYDNDDGHGDNSDNDNKDDNQISSKGKTTTSKNLNSHFSKQSSSLSSLPSSSLPSSSLPSSSLPSSSLSSSLTSPPSLKSNQDNNPNVNLHKVLKFTFKRFNQLKCRAELSGGEYSLSKLALLLFTQKMASIIGKEGPTFNVANPGVVNSGLYSSMTFKKNPLIYFTFAPIFWFFTKTSKDGAQTAFFCATAQCLDGVTGKYFIDCSEKKILDLQSQEVGDALYSVSRSLTGLKE